MGTRSWKALQTLRHLKHRIHRSEGMDPYEALEQAVLRAQSTAPTPMGNQSPPETAIPMGRRPLVSVLMPIHNHAHLAGDAITSVLAQHYEPIELIIVDDGSTDDLDAVLNRFQEDPRVHIHRSKRQGLPRTLSQLHELAQGEFITWTSADNHMLPEALQFLVHHFKRHPRAMMVYADVRLIDGQGQPLTDGEFGQAYRDPADPSILRLPHSADALAEFPDNFINGCFCYRRDAIDAIGRYYAEDLPGLEDYDFWLRLQKAGPLRHVKSSASPYLYRVHDQSLTHELAGARKAYLDSASRRLLDYDQRREDWCNARWTVQLAGPWPESPAKQWHARLEQLPVNIHIGDEHLEHEKVIQLRLDSRPTDGRYTARLNNSTWHCQARIEKRDKPVQWRVPSGVAVPALATKTRHLQGSHAIPAAGDRPIIGIHRPLSEIESIRESLESQRDLYFAWIGVPGDQPKAFPKLKNGCFATAAPWGTAIDHYAGWDAILDINAGSDEDAYALALAIGKWTLMVRSGAEPALPEWGPYQIALGPDESWRAEVERCRHHPVDADVADRHLAWRSTKNRLRHMLRLFNAAGQENHVSRPDFGAPADWTHPT